MSSFFRPNLRRSGRIARGVAGALCLMFGIIWVDASMLKGLIVIAAGLVALAEAITGWCLVRACGSRIKI